MTNNKDLLAYLLTYLNLKERTHFSSVRMMRTFLNANFNLIPFVSYQLAECLMS